MSSALKLAEDRLLELIDSSPERRIAWSQAGQAFRARFGVQLDHKRLGYPKFRNMIEAMPGVATKGGTSQNPQYLCRAESTSRDASWWGYLQKWVPLKVQACSARTRAHACAPTRRART